MKVIEEKNNELLNREELKFIVEAEKSPSIEEAKEIVVKHFKASGELIAVKKVQGKFGRNTFLISAFVYKNKEDKAKLEKIKGKKEAGKQQEKQEAKE